MTWALSLSMTAHDFQLSCYLIERIQIGLERKRQEENVGNQGSAHDLLKGLQSDKQGYAAPGFFPAVTTQKTFFLTKKREEWKCHFITLITPLSYKKDNGDTIPALISAKIVMDLK